jgi:hypothetical protein
VIRSAGQFYADAGLPCPPNRAMADHFIFSMNTDFKKVARDFMEDENDGDIESFMPYLPRGAAAALALPTTIADAERGIEVLRKRFESNVRVRSSSDALFLVKINEEVMIILFCYS